MSKRFSILLVAMSILAIFVGCAGYGGLPSADDPKYGSQPVDVNKDGDINGEDVRLLEIKANECFDACVPFYKKAGIELKRENSTPLIDILKSIDTEENKKLLEENLTFADYKKLVKSRDKLNRVVRQLEATETEVAKDKESDFGVVTGLLYYPDRLMCVLKDGRAVMLIGISVPTHASKYRKMSDDMFYKLALNKKVKIKYDILKSGDNFLYGYLYIKKVFVNEEMVAKGYAWATPTPPNNKHNELFMKQEREARKNKRGFTWRSLTEIYGIDENGSFGVVVGLSAGSPDWLICQLKNELLVIPIGIRVPTHASKYRKMSDDKFYELTLNKLVKIKYDVLKSGGDFLHGYIYVDDTFVNAEMVSRGYARAKPTLQNSKYDSLFMKLEKYAKESKLGIWAFTDDW